jgi:hypothetical protein
MPLESCGFFGRSPAVTITAPIALCSRAVRSL